MGCPFYRIHRTRRVGGACPALLFLAFNTAAVAHQQFASRSRPDEPSHNPLHTWTGFRIIKCHRKTITSLQQIANGRDFAPYSCSCWFFAVRIAWVGCLAGEKLRSHSEPVNERERDCTSFIGSHRDVPPRKWPPGVLQTPKN